MTNRHGPARGRAIRTALALAALATAGFAAPAAAQRIADGALLVASDELEDPNFTKAVVLILRHDDNGTLGLVVNRITSLQPAGVFPDLGPLVTGYQGTLFRGGPVQPSQLLFLVRGLAAVIVNGPEIVDRVFLAGEVEALPDLVKAAPDDKNLRIYAGHAEWAPGQLEAELAERSWKVVPGSAALVFDAEPTRLWERASAMTTDGVVADGADRGSFDGAQPLATTLSGGSLARSAFR